MDRAQLHRLDLNLLLAFDALISERNVTKAAQFGEFGGEIEHANVRLPVRLPYPTRASRTRLRATAGSSSTDATL
jgi:hypothetical protein